jgi:hypothetical protein
MSRMYRKCAVSDCDGDAGKAGAAQGYCVKHYQRVKKYGDPSAVKFLRGVYGKVCAVPECEKPAHTKGYCAAHGAKFKKYGDPLGSHPNPRQGKNIRWLEAHVGYDGEGCLIWPFGVNDNGRGNVKGVSAPRYMCRLAHGNPPDESFHAAHICGMGHLGCVHPKHLRWASPAENEADKLKHGTLRRGSDVNTSKLSREDVIAIRASSESGVSLAAKYGVTPAAISAIRTGKNWHWL